MKNQIELPKINDFHETAVVDYMAAQNQLGHEKDGIKYFKANINMRTITDFVEAKVTVTVLDSEKFAEYEKAKKEWVAKMNRSKPPGVPPIPENFGGLRGFGPEIGGFDNPDMPTAVAHPMDSPIINIGPMDPMPKAPTKEIELKGTYILYYNGAQRMIVDDFNDFKEKYFNYLQSQKLDI